MRRRFLLLSLLVHGGCVLLTGWLARQFPPASRPSVEYVEVDWLGMRDEKTIQQGDKKEPTLSSSSMLPKQQVVEQEEKSLNDEIPEESRFLSATNQVVKKQTKAMQVGEFKNRGQNGWKNFQPQSQWLQQSGIKAREQSTGRSLANEDQDALTTALKRRYRQQAYEGNPSETSSRAQGARRSQVPNMLPQGEGEGGSATMDYLPDIDPGLETLLSTREFVYYTFYKRMRQQLSQYWTPQVRSALQRIYSSGRRIASSHALVTRCLITLNAKGDLVRVSILGNSGFYELDQAAFQALKEAAPFRNPPRGMIDEDGLIRIRWDFVVDS